MNLDAKVELVARIIDPAAWEVMDGQWRRFLHKFRDQDVLYDTSRFKHKESMSKAREVLTALEQSDAEREQPECPSCGGLNTSCPDGCGRDPSTGELNGTRLSSHPGNEG